MVEQQETELNSRDIEEEPTHAGAEEHLTMTPFQEIGDGFQSSGMRIEDYDASKSRQRKKRRRLKTVDLSTGNSALNRTNKKDLKTRGIVDFLHAVKPTNKMMNEDKEENNGQTIDEGNERIRKKTTTYILLITQIHPPIHPY